MNSENSLLPPFVIASLYKDELVLIDDQKSSNADKSKNGKAVVTVAQEIQKPISYLGDNQKKVTILLQDNTAVHVADESLQFLTAILAACKLNMGDVAIVNTVHQPVQYTQIKT